MAILEDVPHGLSATDSPAPLHLPGEPLLVHPPVALVAILERDQGQPDALITILEEPQEHYGYHPIQARIGQCVPPGTVFLSFHYKEAPANLLTQGFALDLLAEIPEYEICAVRLKHPRTGVRGTLLPPAISLPTNAHGPGALPSRGQPAE